MPGSFGSRPCIVAMQKADVRFASKGDPSLLVWRISADISHNGQDLQAFVIPLMSRSGGMLLAVPQLAISDSSLLDAAFNDEDSFLGPSREFSADLVAESDEGAEIPVGQRQDFLVVDVLDQILAGLRESDPVTDSTEEIVSFCGEKPDALVAVGDVIPEVASWLENISGDQGRLNFYSAREEQEMIPVPKPKKAAAKKITTAALAEQMSSVMAQLQLLTSQQEILAKGQMGQHADPVGGHPLGATTAPKLPNVSAGLQAPSPGAVKKALSLVGPPPRTRAPHAPEGVPDVPGPLGSVVVSPGEVGGDHASMVAAISQQSAALTSLVAHLASGDVLTDLQGSSSSVGVSTKGVARRERMQQELASRNSQFFLQVQQQIFKKMYPARVCPKTEEELVKSQVSMTSYLEKYGAFKGQREMGLIMWMLAHCMDAASQGDFYATKEFLALMAAAMEQSVLDGNWQIAYVVGLLEEPPAQLFAERLQSTTSLGRPFSPLVPPSWAAVSLSYVKEIDLLSTKKGEVRPKTTAKADPESSPSPKRRPRFPKRPKSGDAPKAA